MAPTEILAFQHYQSLVKLFSGLNVSIGLLTGSQAEVCHSDPRKRDKLRGGIPYTMNLSLNKDSKITKYKGSFDSAKAPLRMTVPTTAGQKKEVITQLKNGEIHIIVGTHALLSENVVFKKLALVVVAWLAVVVALLTIT